VAKQINKSAAQVSLNWAATQPGITSTIIGASKLVQLEDNLRSVEFEIPLELRMKLDEVSAVEAGHPYEIFSPDMQGMVSGGTSVYPWAPARVYATPSRDPGGVKAQAAKK
jgi:hypothetical protein